MLGFDLFHFHLLHSRGRPRYSFGVGRDRLWRSNYRKLGGKQQRQSAKKSNNHLLFKIWSLGPLNARDV